MQYAHARIASLLRNAAESGVTRGDQDDPGLLTHGRENDLLKALAQFPRVVAAAELRQPHRVARYLEDLAAAYHRFHDACRVLPRGSQPLDALGQARLWLADASRIVLANGLGLLGVTAPDRLWSDRPSLRRPAARPSIRRPRAAARAATSPAGADRAGEPRLQGPPWTPRQGGGRDDRPCLGWKVQFRLVSGRHGR